MQYPLGEAAREVARRANRLRLRRLRQQILRLAAGCQLLALALVFCLAQAKLPAAALPARSAPGYGALLLSGGIGGYVLVGVIAFMAGVCAAVGCRALKKRKKRGGRYGRNGF
jgi:hypothetical protein